MIDPTTVRYYRARAQEYEQIYYRDGGHGSYHGADTDHYDLVSGR